MCSCRLLRRIAATRRRSWNCIASPLAGSIARDRRGPSFQTKTVQTKSPPQSPVGWTGATRWQPSRDGNLHVVAVFGGSAPPVPRCHNTRAARWFLPHRASPATNSLTTRLAPFFYVRRCQVSDGIDPCGSMTSPSHPKNRPNENAAYWWRCSEHAPENRTSARHRHCGVDFGEGLGGAFAVSLQDVSVPFGEGLDAAKIGWIGFVQAPE